MVWGRIASFLVYTLLPITASAAVRDEAIARAQSEVDVAQKKLDQNQILAGDIYGEGSNYTGAQYPNAKESAIEEMNGTLASQLKSNQTGKSWLRCINRGKPDCSQFEKNIEPALLPAIQQYKKLKFYTSISPQTLEAWTRTKRDHRQANKELATALSHLNVLKEEEKNVQKWSKDQCTSDAGSHRLDDKKADGQPGVLADFSVTDQGHLGSCYANATSLLLKYTTGKNLSFVDIALHNKAYSNRDFLSEGDICDAFKTTKKYGGCESKYSFYEDSKSPHYKDASIISKFSETLHMLKGLPPTDLGFLQTVSACVPIRDLNPPDSDLGEFLQVGSAIFSRKSNGSVAKNQLLARMKNFVENIYYPELFGPSESRPKSFSPFILDQLKTAFSDAPDFIRYLLEEYTGTGMDGIYQHDVQNLSSRSQQYTRFIRARSQVQQAMEMCSERQSLNLDALANLSKDISDINGNLADEIMSKMVASSNEDQYDAFQLLVAPECLDPTKRVTIPVSASCTDQRVPKSTTLSPEEPKKWLIHSVMSEIKAGRPIGLSYCPKILDGVADAHPEMDCTNTGHASAITGYRWNGDKNTCEIQIWNSWGMSSGKENWVAPEKLLQSMDKLSIVGP